MTNTATGRTDSLLPCPFCGSVAHPVGNGKQIDGVEVFAVECGGCSASGHTSNWNDRAQVAKLEFELAEMEAENRLARKMFDDGLWCELDDQNVRIAIEDDSDSSVGLYGAAYLTLTNGYTLLPDRFLNKLKSHIGDYYDEIVADYQEDRAALAGAEHE